MPLVKPAVCARCGDSVPSGDEGFTKDSPRCAKCRAVNHTGDDDWEVWRELVPTAAGTLIFAVFADLLGHNSALAETELVLDPFARLVSSNLDFSQSPSNLQGVPHRAGVGVVAFAGTALSARWLGFTRDALRPSSQHESPISRWLRGSLTLAMAAGTLVVTAGLVLFSL